MKHTKFENWFLRHIRSKNFKVLGLVKKRFPYKPEHVKGKCWIPLNRKPDPCGYIRVSESLFNGERFLHRIAWMYGHCKSGVPVGFEVDHMCRNPRCCNPTHLQILTRSEHATKTNIERAGD